MNNLLYQLKNKNINTEKIIEILAQTTKIEKDITKIKIYNNNLLLFSCVYDNFNLFDFLSKTFHQDFINDFKSCIMYCYTNKNPQILKTSFNYLPEQNDDEKNQLFNLFACNCYRQENIEIVESWLQKNLNTEQIKNFILKLFEYNNRPFLNIICKLKFWKPFLIESLKGTSDLYFLKLINEPIEHKIDFNIDTEINFSNNTEIESKNEKIVKRKKKVISLTE